MIALVSAPLNGRAVPVQTASMVQFMAFSR